jgi:NO-binding membrane sensor protein with MHYT domain/two-component sensor histidine kinase
MGDSTFLSVAYDWEFVGLSLTIAVIASAVSLDVAARIPGTTGWVRGAWISAAGVAMGGGIWAMHFIGMLALSLPVSISYDIPITLMSLALAIAATAAAFLIVSEPGHRLLRLGVGGLFMGAGVAGMHYTGMSATRLPVLLGYDLLLVAASVAIAVVAATAALWLATSTAGPLWRLLAAVVMGLAVASMHYTGMAATCFSVSSIPAASAGQDFNRDTLVFLVTISALTILSLGLLSASFDRHLATLRLRESEVARQARLQAEAALAELKATQNSLVQAEKMASLSQLTAGVAHEINTPIGTALTAATVLQRRTEEFVQSVAAGSITKTAALKYADVARESSTLIVANIERAATLVQSFKQVAVDQTSGERRTFTLNSYLHEVLHSLTPRLKQTAHTVRVECSSDIVVNSYPGALAQIVTNLVVNSLVHAYPDGRTGTILLRAAVLNSELIRLEYQDDGKGIPRAHLSRVFDPFFTTRRGEGGTGLGLHIIYNLVTQTLGGKINVETDDGVGTRFVVDFPVGDPPISTGGRAEKMELA